MGHADLRSAVRPLRWIFWGGLLCAFDLQYASETDGHGWKVDLLNDVVGLALVVAGLVRLLAVRVHDRYATVLRVCIAVAALALLDAGREHFLRPWPRPVVVASEGVRLLGFVATVLFCVAMRWLCDAYGLRDASRSWRTTMILFLVVWAVPLGGLQLLLWTSILAEVTWSVAFGPGFVLLALVMAVPLVHFFVSTTRTARAAEDGVRVMPDPDLV